LLLAVAVGAAYISRIVTEARTMTPQELALVTELFDRLATIENQPRDPDAERAIIEGLRRAPNAAYALVQTDGMRDALLGRRDTARGSVPSVPPAPMRPAPEQPQEQSAANAPGAAAWRQGPAAPGGSFLGTAASAAAGVIGGSLLLDGIRSMMGPGHGSAFGFADPAIGASREPGSPWDNSGGGDLARQAGTDDIGRDAHTGGGSDSGSGLFGNTTADDGADAQADQDLTDIDDSGSDFGDGDFDSSDA
jgi:hypothetical protein